MRISAPILAGVLLSCAAPVEPADDTAAPPVATTGPVLPTADPEPRHRITNMSFGADFGYDPVTDAFVPVTDPDGVTVRPSWWVVWGTEDWTESCTSTRFLDDATLEDEDGDYRWSIGWPEVVEGASDCQALGFDLGFFEGDDPLTGSFDPYVWWNLEFGGPVPDSLFDWVSIGPADPFVPFLVGTRVTSNRVYYGGENTYMIATEVDATFTVVTEDGDPRFVLADDIHDPKTGELRAGLYRFRSPWHVRLLPRHQ